MNVVNEWTLVVPARQIVAMRYFAADRDIRYYLNAICVEGAGDHAVLVSTDGHRIAALRVSQPLAIGVETIIHIDLFRAIKVASGEVTLHFHNGRVTVSFDDASFEAEAVNGKYPNWRHVFPEDSTGVMAQFNARYLGDLGKACKAFVEGSLPMIAHNGDGPALVSFGDDDTIIAAIMPLRETHKPTRPSWSRAPVAETVTRNRNGGSMNAHVHPTFAAALAPYAPPVTRDELLEAAVKLLTAVNMFMGTASPLKPLTLDQSAVNIIKAQAAGLEYAVTHGKFELPMTRAAA